MLRLLFVFCLLVICCGLPAQNVTVAKSSEIVVIRGKNFYLHTVQPGQTLYSICKAYGVTVDEIKSLNDKQDNNLSLYEVLKIPYVEPFVQQDGKYYYHKVSKGETLYSIARSYKIKPKRLLRFNTEYSHNEPLAVGAVLRLPLKEIEIPVRTEVQQVQIVRQKEVEKPVDTENTGIVSEKTVVRQDSVTPVRETSEQLITHEDTGIPDYISEVVMPGDPFVKIALMLPFSAKDYPLFIDTLVGKVPVKISPRAEQFIAFYEGVLLAVDSLKSRGYKIDLHVYDTERNADKMYYLAQEINQLRPDLILGPVYGSVYKSMAGYLQNKQIPMIYPLSSRSENFGEYPNFVQVNPSSAALTSAMTDWLREQINEANVVYIDTRTGSEYSSADVAERQGFKTSVKQVGGINIFNWDTHTIPLDSLRGLLSPERENIMVLPVTKEAEVTKILPLLSALTDGYRITVVGLPEWQTFTSVDHETYYKLNTKIFSYSYIDNASEPAKAMAEKYRKYFYTEPNSLVFKAFDLGLYFIDLAVRYRDRTLEAIEFFPANGAFSRFRFEKRQYKAGVENRSFFIVNYGSDYKLKIENLN